jgi:N-acetylmuramoyl-L-alanine amidase
MKRAFIVPLLIIYFVSYSSASRYKAVEGIRYASYKTYTRVVVDISSSFEFSESRLSNPDRLFFDLKNCRLSKKVQSYIPIKNNVLKTIRVAQFNKNTVRVVLDINKFKKYYAFTLKDPYRLVIDVYPDNKTGKDKKSLVDRRNFRTIKTIVIDPGHGGKDPGAIGSRGLKEKDTVLYVGKRVGKILEKKYGMKVIYTRDKDVFIPLNERTEIANTNKADLFISIHTNASNKRNTRGIETYFLNWTNNREAMRVAARENKISLNNMQKVQDELQKILLDLARKNKNEESMRLAHSVQNAMVNTLKKNYRRIEDLGVKYALFYVLIGAEMPSILVEISFITHREEERRLATRRYKNKIAEAIAKGINAYINESTLIVNPVRSNTFEG